MRRLRASFASARAARQLDGLKAEGPAADTAVACTMHRHSMGMGRVEVVARNRDEAGGHERDGAHQHGALPAGRIDPDEPAHDRTGKGGGRDRRGAGQHQHQWPHDATGAAEAVGECECVCRAAEVHL